MHSIQMLNSCFSSTCISSLFECPVIGDWCRLNEMSRGRGKRTFIMYMIEVSRGDYAEVVVIRRGSLHCGSFSKRKRIIHGRKYTHFYSSFEKMPSAKRSWCCHPCHLQTLPDGKKATTKSGPRPSHPLGSRRINVAFVEYINEKFSVLLKHSLLDLDDNHSLCTRCYEEELPDFERTREENENNNYQRMDDDGFTIDSSDMSELQKEYAVAKLNEVFATFALEPVVAWVYNSAPCEFESNQILYLRRNTLQTQQKVDKMYTVLQEMVNCLTNNENRRHLIDGFISLELSIAEIDDFLYRLRSLVSTSSYHDQVMLLQTSPITWGWKKIEKFFQCTEHQGRQAIRQRTQHGDFTKPVDERGNKALDPAVSQLVVEFYLDDEISRQSSYTKDARKLTKDIVVVIRYLTMSVGETFKLFQSKYPNLSIARSKFYSLRPTWVREDCPHEVCMCVYHQNADLLLKVSPDLDMSNWKTLFFIRRSVEQLEEHWIEKIWLIKLSALYLAKIATIDDATIALIKTFLTCSYPILTLMNNQTHNGRFGLLARIERSCNIAPAHFVLWSINWILYGLLS